MDRPDGSPTAVDVVLRPQWAAKEGTDLNFHGIGLIQPFGGFASHNYTPGPGKTGYLTDIGGSGYGSAAGDRELNQIIIVAVNDTSVATTLALAGGNGGVFMSPAKPIVCPSGPIIVIQIINYSAHNMNLEVYAAGYEV